METILIVSDSSVNQINGVTSFYKDLLSLYDKYGCILNYRLSMISLESKKNNSLPTSIDHIIPIFPLCEFSSPFYKDQLLGFVFKRKIARYSKDVDIFWIATPGPLGNTALNIALKRNKPVVAYYHTHFPTIFKNISKNSLVARIILNFIWKYYIQRLYNQCDLIICESEYQKTNIEKYFNNDKVIVNTPGINLKMFNSDIIKYDKGEIKPTIYVIGRISPEKHIDIVNTIAKLGRDIYRIVWIGYGPYKKQIIKYSHVEIIGWVDRSKIAEYIYNGVAYLSACEEEGFGISCIEAMTSGLPIIVPKYGGLSEIIKKARHRIGFTYESPEEAHRIICNLCSNNILRKKLSKNVKLESQYYDLEVRALSLMNKVNSALTC